MFNLQPNARLGHGDARPLLPPHKLPVVDRSVLEKVERSRNLARLGDNSHHLRKWPPPPVTRIQN
jgi:hypothetical protein